MKSPYKIALAFATMAILGSVGFASAQGYGGGGDVCKLPADRDLSYFERLRSLSGRVVHTTSVKLAAGDGDEKFMLVSNKPDFSDAVTLPYSRTFNWTLTSGYGRKTVYLRFLNSCKLMPSRSTSVSLLYTKKPVFSFNVFRRED